MSDLGRGIRFILWMIVATVVTVFLCFLLQPLGWSDAQATADSKYYFGVWIGLLMGRYFVWFDHIEKGLSQP